MNKLISFLIINLFLLSALNAKQSKLIIVNQLGYNLNVAKRFVCYDAKDGAEFKIYRFTNNKRINPILFKGFVKNFAGDFTSFNPNNSKDEYVISIDGLDTSYPFNIEDFLMEKKSSKLAYEHFIDVRGGYSYLVSPANITGGGPSRDGGGQTLEALFEGLLYMSNPALFDRWTNGLTGFVTMRANYLTDQTPDYSNYNEMPQNVWKDENKVPDLIKLMLWHAEFCYNNIQYNKLSGGAYENWPSYDGIRKFGYKDTPLQSFDYQNMLDQLAAICAYYPCFLNKYITEEQYQKYRNACLNLWEHYDRQKEVRYWVKSYKWIDLGYREFNEQGNAFGQGLFRNLMMYISESTQKDGGQSAKFLKYTQDCATDIIKNWDFENPWHTWAVRNAEHITAQALAFFYLTYPQLCPVGTKEKLESYSNYIYKRTSNPWNYRTHSDTEWAHPKSKEIGTVCGLGGSLFAVAEAINDTKLRDIGWSQVNFVFGCNPANACLSHKSKARVALGGYWPGIEQGWPHDFGWGTGELALCRGTMDGSPTNQGFPYKPDSAALADFPGVYGTEGWAISNRAWLSAVAFSTLGSNTVSVFDAQFKPIEVAKNGDIVIVQLKAPLNLNDSEVEKAYVIIHQKNANQKRLILDETTKNSGIFQAKFKVKNSTGDELSFSYGYLGFKKEKILSIL